jgi:hypothetical protein
MKRWLVAGVQELDVEELACGYVDLYSTVRLELAWHRNDSGESCHMVWSDNCRHVAFLPPFNPNRGDQADTKDRRICRRAAHGARRHVTAKKFDIGLAG